MTVTNPPLSDPVPFCSVVSAELDEPLPGTAATAVGWVCFEQPGAWGRDILDGHALDPVLSDGLADASAANRVRIQFVRRPGRSTVTERRTVLLAHSVVGRTWCEELTVTDPAELLALVPLAALPDAPGVGTPVRDPVVLVCTHGRRDRCCALFGRPVAAALAADRPGAVWETSHTGGHRFAPSMIVLPSGYTYGRVDVAAATRVVADAGRGVVATEGLRGRSAYSAAEQAADVAVREDLPGLGPDDLTAVPTDDGVVVRHRDGRAWVVEVAEEELPPRPASCGAVPKTAVAVAAVRTARVDDAGGRHRD